MRDDLGAEVVLPRRPRRVVSLVPSLTEAVAASAPDLLVGATDWCTHPAGLDVTRVRGTKNPDLRAITDLDPGVVIATKEENRELDVRRLRAAGVAVWVSDIETVPGALTSMRRLLVEVLGVGAPPWLTEAEERWAGPVPPPHLQVAVPIWRDPWMVIGAPTYTADLMARLGWATPFADPSRARVRRSGTRPERYPTVELAELDDGGLDLVLLPDEPYAFSADDGPEAFVRTPTRLVSGRLLTWYGPAMLEAHDVLADLT